ncbi:putative holin [Acidovorax sp. SUPP1855]|uniref:putative holin n=1 Tax=Acidovorax sp. SUPP1855 TaxID=431774 RepID=UPI0023DE2E88|nr:putative holin [Acidovorax sp. SUPP1855]GKS85552.1 putative holin [Acidovorax sp. SUPP1855]
MQLRDSIPVWLRAPRNSLWLVLAVVLIVLIAAIAPQKLSLTIYKASLVALAAVMGYWLDRALFPYARPDSYLHRDWRLGTTEPEHDADFPIVQPYLRAFCAAQLRRAIVVAAVVIGVAQGI